MAGDSTCGRTEVAWQLVGDTDEIKSMRCRRLFAESGKSHDLVLVYYGDEFHALEAWCSHMGGPLFNGDIEDYKGRAHLMCPWHGYQFDLQTGKSEIGIMQEKFPTKTEDGKVYVQYQYRLSTKPFTEDSKPTRSSINSSLCRI